MVIERVVVSKVVVECGFESTDENIYCPALKIPDNDLSESCGICFQAAAHKSNVGDLTVERFHLLHPELTLDTILGLLKKRGEHMAEYPTKTVDDTPLRSIHLRLGLLPGPYREFVLSRATIPESSLT